MTVSPDILELQAGICRAMGQPVRLQILQVLRCGPMRVSEIAGRTGLTPGQASRHLAVLREHALVIARRDRQDVVYSLANPLIPRICDSMRELLTEQLRQLAALVQSAE